MYTKGENVGSNYVPPAVNDLVKAVESINQTMYNQPEETSTTILRNGRNVL